MHLSLIHISEAIRPDDSGEYHRYRTSSDSDRVTVLLHMRRTENGIAFCKTTRSAVVMLSLIHISP